VTPWFTEHSVCPTGCGCECVLVTTTIQAGDPPLVSSRPLEPMLDKFLNEAPELLIAGAGQLPL
jgi:hypothetical protein